MLSMLAKSFCISDFEIFSLVFIFSFFFFQQRLTFHANCLPGDILHGVSMPILKYLPNFQPRDC